MCWFQCQTRPFIVSRSSWQTAAEGESKLRETRNGIKLKDFLEQSLVGSFIERELFFTCQGLDAK